MQAHQGGRYNHTLPRDLFRLEAGRGFVKICGIRTAEEAVAAVAAGADAIGLLCGLLHRSEDAVDAVLGRRIRDAAKATDPRVAAVLVSHLEEADAVATLAQAVRVDIVQIHSAMPVAEVARLRALLPHAALIKAVHVTGIGPAATHAALASAAPYATSVDAFLTDSMSRDPDGTLRVGGTGIPNDPKAAHALRSAFHLPVFLAGGLRPESVAAMAAEARCDGVDVNSGVERADGSKCPRKMTEFCREARKGIGQGRLPPPLAPSTREEETARTAATQR